MIPPPCRRMRRPGVGDGYTGGKGCLPRGAATSRCHSPSGSMQRDINTRRQTNKEGALAYLNHNAGVCHSVASFHSRLNAPRPIALFRNHRLLSASSENGQRCTACSISLSGTTWLVLTPVLSFIYKPPHAARRAMAAACRCLEATATFQNDHILSQIEMINPSRALLSPSPHTRQTKERTACPFIPRREKREITILAGPAHPPPLRRPSPPPASSGGVLLALMHFTLVPPKTASTASMGFSFHNHLPERALGCFHPVGLPCPSTAS